jgi:hypothetical protein
LATTCFTFSLPSLSLLSSSSLSTILS